VISDSDDVTTDSSQIVRQVATTTATPRHRSAFRVITPSVYNRIHLRKIKKKKKRNKAKTKVVLPSRSTKPSPVISVSVLHLRSRNCGFNQSKQYVSRILRGYRRLKKLFKVRDPSPFWFANLAYRKLSSSISSFLALSFFFSFSPAGGNRRDRSIFARISGFVHSGRV